MKKIAALVFFCFFVSYTSNLSAQTGKPREVKANLDPLFGTGGRLEADPGGFGGQIMSYIAAKGTPIVVAGLLNTASPGLFHLGMMKCDTSGILDPTFGTGGLVNLSWSRSDYSNDMQEDALGNFILAGAGDSADEMLPTIYRVKSNGTPDSTFGTNGRFAAAFSPGSIGEASNIVNNGTKYFIYGTSRKKTNGSGVSGFGMMAVKLDGTLDLTSGVNGSFVIAEPVHSVRGFYGWKNGASSILCGISDTGNHEILLALFDFFGRPDFSFGLHGVVHTGIFAEGDTIFSAAPNGRTIVVMLPARDSSPTRITLCRFDTSGKLDTLFNRHGSGIAINLISPSFQPKGLSATNDQILNICGMAHVGLGESIYIRISDTTGTPDSLLNGNGVVANDVDNGAYANYLKFERPIGKLDSAGLVKRFIGAGGSIHNGVQNFMVARFVSSPAEGIVGSDIQQEKISLYPNPVSSTLTINAGNSPINSIHSIDELGREVGIPFHSNSSGAYTGDVSKLPAGIYYCIIQTENEQIARKFIKN
jgi:hypothetical protein